MEVLSIGEKIKRARIYKGYTLKDVCGDKISVSKLSCIENEKVQPENWILEYISEKLDLDITYLKQKVENQIENNIINIKENFQNEEYEKKVIYNLNLAKKYGYNQLALNITHLIFEYYLEKNYLSKAQVMLGDYYDLCNNSDDEKNILIYYLDAARLFYKNGEFVQAENYYKSIKKEMKKIKNKDYLICAESIYGEASCNIKLNKYDNLSSVGTELKEIINYIDDDLNKAKIYHMIAIIYLRLNDKKFEEYENKALEIYKDANDYKAKAMLDCGINLWHFKDEEKAGEYIKKALDIYPKDNEEKLVKFMVECVEKLLHNNISNELEKLLDKSLDYAIKINNIKYIEKVYYLKAKFLQNQGNILLAETYMNLSLDALDKFGNKKEMYVRYMEMGKMYHDIGSIKESLKYFTLAILTEKKLKTN